MVDGERPAGWSMANGQLGQRTPGHRVLLAGGGLARPVERLCGPQVPRYSQHQAPPRFPESRTRLTITGRCTGLLTTFRGSASDTPTRFPRAPELQTGQASRIDRRCELSAGPA